MGTAGISAAALAAGVSPALADAKPSGTRSRGRRVAVFGTGVAGMSAIHELVDRGFEVEAYERFAMTGGKTRGWSIPRTGTHGRLDLPSEHGFRFFPGFYRNLTDSMQRTPRPERGDTCFDSLRWADKWHGFGAAASLSPRSGIAIGLPFNLNEKVDQRQLGDPKYLATVLIKALGLTKGIEIRQVPEVLEFIQRILVYLTSSDLRRHTQWDAVSWQKFLQLEGKSNLMQLIGTAITELIQSTKAADASALCGGNIFDAFVWNGLGVQDPGTTFYLASLLDGPTGEVWMNPWRRYMESRGVRFHTSTSLHTLTLRGDEIDGAIVVDSSGAQRRVDADWYVSAIGTQQLGPIIKRSHLAAKDPKLGHIGGLGAGWMNNLQFYLRKPPSLAYSAVVVPDHPWSMSGFFLGFQWRDRIAKRYGDGSVHQILSLIVSQWDTKGPGMTIVSKRADRCSRQEVFQEVWGTLKERFGDLDPAFRDDNLIRWTIDPGITWSEGNHGVVRNSDPLSTNEVNTWDRRPAGPTGIKNFFIGGDFNATYLYVGAMDSAAEGGRQAARAVVEASGRKAKDVEVFPYLKPAAMNGIWAEDKRRYRRGQRNIFDTPASARRSVVADLSPVVVDAASMAGLHLPK
ncbi:hydroxysqualene dehydroxylase [Gordonia zhenghanii]|uniref:hydroxysqualene dehydroxylase n=1 Tax=Gordonia zhenghanii TaxID=2911516 RepID=UPI0027E07699|nr:FAD-dependent oxidoreductase [Gordonia zhenghanii]